MDGGVAGLPDDPSSWPVPYCKQFVSQNAMKYVTSAVQNSSASTYRERSQAQLASLVNREVLLTPSCSAALEMAAILTEVSAGDEVIVPSFTFATTASAFALFGATIVFVDSDPMTLNIDPSQVVAAISPRTKVIVVVHYAGIACDMDSLLALAETRGIVVVEDCAHALLATYKGRQLGSFGHLAAFSFHSTKNISCVEGGALCVRRDCKALWPRARVIWDKGTNRQDFIEGKSDKYVWVDRGSSFALSEVSAALLLAQLEAGQEITAKRRMAWGLYHEQLEACEMRGWLRRPVVPALSEHNAHIYYILFPNAQVCQAVLSQLRSQGVEANRHYSPLHSSPAGQRFGHPHGTCAVSEHIAEVILRLPLWPDIPSRTVGDITQSIASALNAIYGSVLAQPKLSSNM